MTSRSMAREIAVHNVYLSSFAPDPAETVGWSLDPFTYALLAEEDTLYATAPEEGEADYIRRVVGGTIEHLAELDDHIKTHAVGWKISRLPRLSCAILRVCLYELIHLRDEIPTASAVNAAVKLAKKYEDDPMPGFINGILGSFVRETLAEEIPEQEISQETSEISTEECPEEETP